MRNFFIVLVLWLGTASCFAAGPNAHINCASTSLGSTYTAVFPQLAVTGLVSKSHFSIINNTTSAVCCNLVTASPLNPPSSGGSEERCFPANTYAFVDFTPIAANVYCRSLSGTISDGTIDIANW
jgi:hypothetical protein